VTRQVEIPAVILAGGEGTRIGGRKAHVRLGGRPLVAHVIDRLAPQAGPLALNAGPEAGLEGLGLAVLPDAVPGQGPLGGILVAMRWAGEFGAERVLTAAVDTPFLPADLVQRLAGADARAAYAVTPGGPHATTGLWSVDLAPGLELALDDGARKVRDWTEAVGAVGVSFEDEAAFFNVNTQADLAAAERRLR
jgi:molybdenum cofactor guanylyltransferase